MAGFDQQQAGVLMTLASIAYADSSGSLPKVRNAIMAELAKPHYATQGQWQLVWGPVIEGEGDNLMYVARRDNQYAIVLRGTVGDLGSFWEDVPTGQVAFSYAGPEAKVSSHFDDALQALLKGADHESGQRLSVFLAQTLHANSELFVTGHSQGGGLTPMLVAWALSERTVWPQATQVNCQGYAFAPPTSGNTDFARWIAAHAISYQVINPLDVVPCGYAAIDSVISKHIPDKVPFEYKLLIEGAADLAADVGEWEQPQQQVMLQKIQLPDSISYLHQVLDQHNHNSYQWLLGSPQTDIGDPSNLPEYAKTEAAITD
ncbi:hypothetical protein R50073_28350 [Maricurvus nonylphenolicus]|uniref:lipase family protein n=1 Tax=Maricurvus nonylphenolicus TaxID=1008307 RepID=UPI0036F265A7